MNFLKDDLGRQKFADLLISYSASLASASVSPAGRVIAVDAPWGSGKSWIAKRLPAHFQNDARIGKCVYIDAFEFDFHSDPFAVVTSAILDELKEHTTQVASLREAATQVLRVSLPAIGKGLIKAGGRAIGVDAEAVVGSILDAGSDASERAIELMLESFSKTKATTAAFKKKLEELTASTKNGAPLVVVIDELDRCRPSYALELLERVKHLFDAKNVVFIFFVHSPALHSAIRKTYGQDIDAVEYLKKFFSLTVGLPIADRPLYKQENQSDFISMFMESQFEPSKSRWDQEFRSAISTFAPAFNASFRDIESVMLLWQILPRKNNFDPHLAGLALLLKVTDPSQFLALKSDNPSACEIEINRLGPAQDGDDRLISYIRNVFRYAVNPETYAAVDLKSQNSTKTITTQEARAGLQEFQRLLSELAFEYLRL
jgi:hypothetical protein